MSWLRLCVSTSLFAVLLLTEWAPQAHGQPASRPAAEYDVRRQKTVMVPMRDSVRLATDLYFPVGAEMPQPVILIRTPYNKNDADEHAAARFFAGQGYVAAVQDMRGKYESEGRYRWTAHDRQDGYDTVSWLAEQSWSTGRVGSYGCSYRGENQIQLAAERHPNHAAAIPMFAGAMYTHGDRHRNWATNNGGAFELAMIFTWFREKGWSLRPRYPAGTSRDDLLRATKAFDLRPQLPEIDEATLWSELPVVDLMRRSEAPPNLWEDLVSHAPDDPWWEQYAFVTDADRFDVPALQVASWYDYGVSEALGLFNLFQTNGVSATARENQFIIIAPTTHCDHHEATAETIVGARSVGDARLDYGSLYLDWFDHWLRGEDTGITDRPPVQYYLMGKNEWRSADAWPLPNADRTPYFLHSDGHANSRMGDGRLSTKPPSEAQDEAAGETSDTFVYDPASPVPTVGGQACCTQTPQAEGAWDQRAVEMRDDVLVYTSPPLDQGIEVTGPIQATIYLSSSAPDTDVTVKLVDVAPDGTAYNIQEGIRRVRYREGYDRVTRMEKDEVYPIDVNLHATSNYFAAGHRIRVEVSSSNFPRFTRNLNTGGDNHADTTWTTAQNTVHHSADHPSHLVLPVIPAAPSSR